MNEIKAFECSYCRAFGKRQHPFRDKSTCRKHEKGCFRNPVNHACATCALWVDDTDIDRGDLPGFRACADDHQLMGVNFRNGSPTLVLQHDCPHWMPIPEEIEVN